jgi:endonuclease I
LAAFLPFVLIAQIPANYYNDAVGKNTAELKTALHNKIKGHTARTYANLWTDFVMTDSRPNGTVWCMYSNCTFIFGSVASGGHQDGGGAANSECILFNREHSWPQSWFGNNAPPMYTDLFHMYPTDKYVNAQRANHPFGEVSAPTRTFNNGSKLGPCSFPGYTNTVYEPANAYKGDFARTYFYMVTRYEDVVVDWYTAHTEARPTINGTTYPALQSWQLQMLLKWHRQDIVSEKELARNDSVFKIQGNRNPFIDHPELVEYIWGDSTFSHWNGLPTSVQNTEGNVNDLSLQTWFQNDMLHVGGLNVGETWRIYSILGTPVYQNIAKTDVETLHVRFLQNGGTYIIQTGNRSIKIVYQKNIW